MTMVGRWVFFVGVDGWCWWVVLEIGGTKSVENFCAMLIFPQESFFASTRRTEAVYRVHGVVHGLNRTEAMPQALYKTRSSAKVFQ